MRLLLEPEPDTDLDALTAQARAAHAAGLDGILLRQTRSVPVPLIVAAALAGRVDDLLLAVEVDVGDRHPFELAEEVAVVDLASAGRLVLIARPAEGAEDDYGEALDLLRTALTARPFRFEGRRWRVPAELPENVHDLETHVRLMPAPAQVRSRDLGRRVGPRRRAGARARLSRRRRRRPRRAGPGVSSGRPPRSAPRRSAPRARAGRGSPTPPRL